MDSGKQRSCCRYAASPWHLPRIDTITYSPTPAVCAPGVHTRAVMRLAPPPHPIHMLHDSCSFHRHTTKSKSEGCCRANDRHQTHPHNNNMSCFHPNHLSHQRFLPRAAMRLNARPNGLDAGSSAHRHIPPTALLIAIKLLKQSGYSSSLSARPSSRFTAEPRPSRFLAQSASHAHRNDGIGQSPSRGTIS